MSPQCDQLGAYADGQLDAAEADAFELHLAGCAACRDMLHDAMQLIAIEAAARARSTPPQVVTERPTRATERARRRWRRWTAPLAAAAAAAAIVGVWWLRRDPGERTASHELVASADVRGLEGRISYPGADRYRRYDVPRAGSAAAETLSLDMLAGLERKGDLHGVAAAYLLMRDASRASAYLDRATPSADVAADRALLLLTEHPDDALIALDGVLETSPGHAQALWNRALALRDLGLVASSAAAFSAVAEKNEPGWADEARARARALTDRMVERKTAFLQLALTDGPRLSTTPDAVTLSTARRFPGLARLVFYDAVRGAASAEIVRGLAPLARELDKLGGGDVLASYVERVSRADFAVRAPLARRYAALARGQRLDEAGARDLLGALRAARQDDILLGATFLTSAGHVPTASMPEYKRLAAAMHDPWFDLLAIEQEASALIADGDHEPAEALVLPALARCASSALDYRCATLDLVLGQSYLTSLRLADARRVLTDGWLRAQRAGEWNLEQRLLPLLAQLELVEDDVAGRTLPLVRAYAGELTLRAPERCDLDVWSRELVANVLVNRVDLDGARGELARADAIAKTCPAARPGIVNAFVKAHVLRDPKSGSADEVAAVRATIASLRASAGPGMQAVLDQTEGRLLIERDRAGATQLLEHAIEVARTAAPDDVDAHKARSYAYSILTLDAGRANEWDRVWKLLGEDAGFEPAARCALGVAIEDRSSLVVVRDAGGASLGIFDDKRSGPAIDAATLVPATLVAALRGCSSVEVVALPPVQGLPGLLPNELAWSYRLGATASTEPAHGPHLVIAGVEPPAALGMSRLQSWHRAAPGDTVLDGLAATPSRVLAELATASVVEIHAHGMVDAAEADASFLMMSPEPDGRYALTAAAIRKQPLRGHPIVVLAACHAAVMATYRHEPWGLPAAFIASGARAVIASTDVISDAEAGAFFDDLRARMEQGSSPDVALRDARSAWLAARPSATWVETLMVFR
ncbi:MAG: CHAT domain-containing protein [Kofleriaceae bacterium]|nr:CHAT domain-containing protein [Kofleriaceae bacterium]